MKKLTILFVAFITIFSCGDDVEFNTPGFQGLKEYDLWRATSYNASIDENGVLTITGSNNVETVELKVPTVTEGLFQVGDVATIAAKFTDATGTIYSTANDPHQSVSIYPEIGEIRIETIDNLTFTGTFKFLAFNDSGLNSIGFNDGVFTKVPLTSGSIPADPYTCADGAAASALALEALNATIAPDLVFIDSGAYVAACQAYVLALENQRNFCGDVSGEIQDIIDGLNGCAFPCEYAVANSNTALTNLGEAHIGNYIELCNTYVSYLNEQITACTDEDGSIQALIDARDCGDDDNDGIPNVYEDFDGDGDLENDDTDLDGTPNYLDDDDDGDGILTIDEAKDDEDRPIDTDNDLDVDYLDNDDDGDGVLTQYEIATGDTDVDTVPDYLDNDDDGDGLLTVDENADPNGDGNPDDAIDSDANGTPDYLQG